MNRHLLAVGFALVGLVAGSAFAEPTHKEGAKKPEAKGCDGEAKGCEGCEKASAKKGKVGYCEHCGVCEVKMSEENSKKGIEALAKAGYKDAMYYGGVLYLKAEKKDLESIQKALEGLL